LYTLHIYYLIRMKGFIVFNNKNGKPFKFKLSKILRPIVVQQVFQPRAETLKRR
jgi:hypothetical protein